jgi:hypothetical protein
VLGLHRGLRGREVLVIAKVLVTRGIVVGRGVEAVVVEAGVGAAQAVTL